MSKEHHGNNPSTRLKTKNPGKSFNMQHFRIALILLFTAISLPAFAHTETGHDADLVVMVYCQIPANNLIVHFL